MNEDRRTAGPRPERELDAKVEDLVRRLVDLVNEAGPEQRAAVRDYALELLREGTEVDEATPAPATDARTNASGTNPIGIALLLGVLALPATLLFAPVGLVLLAVAVVMGIWGVAATLLRR